MKNLLHYYMTPSVRQEFLKLVGEDKYYMSDSELERAFLLNEVGLENFREDTTTLLRKWIIDVLGVGSNSDGTLTLIRLAMLSKVGAENYGLSTYELISQYFGTSQGDPIIEAMEKANATMYIDMDSAGGLGIEGINSPLTNPIKDLINTNDVTLVNAAGTTADGFDNIVVPSGTVKMFKADGVDTYGTIENNANLDPTGLEDFAICGVFKTDAEEDNGYLLAKNDVSSTPSDFQFGVVSVAGNLTLYYGVSVSFGTISLNAIHSFTIKRISGVLKMKFDGIEVYNEPDTQMLVSKPNIKLFARTTTGGGDSANLDFGLGFMSFFYNGATGLNETDVDNACALAKAKYF